MTSNIARMVVQSLQKPKRLQSRREGLSKQEDEVLTLLAQGYLGHEIADLLGINTSAVSASVRRMYEKLHVLARFSAV